MSKQQGQAVKQIRRPEPMTIERQLLLAQFMGSVMTGMYAHGDHRGKTASQLSDLALMQAALMLEDFERRAGL